MGGVDIMLGHTNVGASDLELHNVGSREVDGFSFYFTHDD